MRDEGRDERRNEKIPYRPTPSTIYPDQISNSQKRFEIRKNSGNSNKIGNGISWAFFLTIFADSVFCQNFPFSYRIYSRNCICIH